MKTVKVGDAVYAYMTPYRKREIYKCLVIAVADHWYGKRYLVETSTWNGVIRDYHRKSQLTSTKEVPPSTRS